MPFDDSDWGTARKGRRRRCVVQPRRVVSDLFADEEVQCWNCGRWIAIEDAHAPCLALDGREFTIMTGFPGQAACMAAPLFCDRECLRTKLDDVKLSEDADAVAEALERGDLDDLDDRDDRDWGKAPRYPRRK